MRTQTNEYSDGTGLNETEWIGYIENMNLTVVIALHIYSFFHV